MRLRDTFSAGRLAAALLGLGLLAGCGETGQEMKEGAGDAVGGALETTGEAVQSGGEKVQGAADNLGGAAESATEAIGKGLEKVGLEETGKSVEASADKIGEETEAATDATGKAIEKAGESIEETGTNLKGDTPK